MRFFTSLTVGPSLGGLAQAAEAAGFEGATLADHVFHPLEIRSRYPYSADGAVFWDGDYPWPDPWVIVGAMAAVTTRLRFITSVYILPLRHPFIVAKAVGTAAFISEDRVILGAGLGWMREEFDQLGEDFATRGDRTDEILEVLRLLWSGGMVEYHGRFYDFDPLQMSPAPRRPIPIYLGGESAQALRRAARLADGFIAVPHSHDEIQDLIRRLSMLREEAGRSSEPFEMIVIAPVPAPAEEYLQLAKLGVDGVILGPQVGPGATAAEHGNALRRFGTEVIAKVASLIEEP